MSRLLLPGLKAAELLRDFKREDGRITQFKEDKRKEIIEEINQLYDKADERAREIRAQEEHSNSDLYEIKLYEKSIFTNKRCMLAYLKGRLELVEKIRWEIGFIPETLANNLSQMEEQYFNDYSTLLANYQKSLGIDFDLTENLSQPPKEPKIHVLVLEDYTGPSFAYGSIVLTKGKRMFMNRTDAEILIKHGVLEQVHS